MDRITAEQRDAIRKSSNERLGARLQQAGWSADDIALLDRERLMQSVAELHAVQADKGDAEEPGMAGAGISTADAIAAKELELREREMLLRERELQVHQQRWEQERLAQQQRWEEERLVQQAERLDQQRRWEAEMELKRAEYERLQRIDAERKAQESSLAARTKKFADSIKHVFVKMSDDPIELPMFFASVENLYRMYEIPRDLQAKLLLPLLNKKARLVTNRLSLTELDDYNVVKQRILTEFRLTSREYLVRFRDLKKQPDESYVYFCSRLQNLLKYYLRSRQADDDPEKIIDVFVSDRLKESLSSSTLNYVLSLEGDGTFSSEKVAATADIHVNNYTEDGKYRSSPLTSKTDHTNKTFVNKTRDNVFVSASVNRSNSSQPVSGTVKTGARLCFKCKSDQHLFANCPLKNVYVSKNSQSSRVSACISADGQRVCRPTTEVQVAQSSEERSRVAHDASGTDNGLGTGEGSSPSSVAVIGLDTNVNNTDQCQSVRIMPLKSIKVVINGKPMDAMIDSGAQVVLLNKAVLPDDVNIVGDIKVQSVFGDTTTASIAPVDVYRCNEDTDDRGVCMLSESMQIFCGLVDNMAPGYDMILPTEIADELSCLPLFDKLSITSCVDETVDVELSDERECTSEECVIDIDQMNNLSVNTVTSDSDITNVDRDSLVDEQRDDADLTSCHALAAAGKGNFVYRNGVLYRGDRVFGQRIWQLVVPQSRREHVLKLAHETGAHLGIRKTSERIRLSFWWKSLKQDVQNFVNSCHSCQLRRRITATDRVPITPIPRATRPFEMIVIDVIGPIDPPAGPQKFKYVLCIVDSFSRFASAYLLRDLTAKSTCQALLEFFAWAGVSSVVISDNGTNFTSSLTKEFMKRMGCSPRFSSPNHPECQGMCERYNQTFKNMLHHAIRENGSQWHLVVPFLVWSLREVSHEVTGVSPYMCVYGFTPKGPLSILRENWAGETELPPNFGKSATQYMQELKENLEVVANYANEHSVNAQERYAHYYNLRARDKHFSVGDRVIVLTPDYNFSHTYARWIGPAVIAEDKSPYSYLVDMPDGSRRHFHANKLRPYIARVSNVGVVNLITTWDPGGA